MLVLVGKRVSDDEARARLGDYVAEVLLLDQGTDAAKARAELDWSSSRAGLVDEFLEERAATEETLTVEAAS